MSGPYIVDITFPVETWRNCRNDHWKGHLLIQLQYVMPNYLSHLQNISWEITQLFSNKNTTIPHRNHRTSTKLLVTTPMGWSSLGNKRKSERLKQTETGWWWNNPFEKYDRQNGFIFPNFRDENSQNFPKIFELPPRRKSLKERNATENPGRFRTWAWWRSDVSWVSMAGLLL